MTVVIGSGGAGNGHWVRARNKKGAETFLAERKMEAERRERRRERDRDLFDRVVGRLRSWFARS